MFEWHTLVPAAKGATEGRAAAQEGVVLSDLVQTTGTAVPVATSSATGSLGLGHIVAASAPGREGHGLGTLAHDDEGEDSDEEERENLVESHLQ